MPSTQTTEDLNESQDNHSNYRAIPISLAVDIRRFKLSESPPTEYCRVIISKKNPRTGKYNNTRCSKQTMGSGHPYCSIHEKVKKNKDLVIGDRRIQCCGINGNGSQCKNIIQVKEQTAIYFLCNKHLN